MKKEIVIIRAHSGEPLIVVGVQKVEPVEFMKLQKEASYNLLSYIADQRRIVNELQGQINDLKKEIKILKGEDESV